jgi:putative transposase
VVGRAYPRAGKKGNSSFQTPFPTNNFGNVNLSQANPFPQRQNPSPGVYILSGQSNIILLTITTDKRLPWLANEAVRRILHQTWSEATAWLVGDYLLMPDHLHLFCAPRDSHFTIEKWISYWKREFTMKQKWLAGISSERDRRLAPPAEGQRLVSSLAPPEWRFQPRGWHHRLRDGENYSEKWLYVQEDPVRKGLVKRIEDWPCKGRVFDLIWSGK